MNINLDKKLLDGLIEDAARVQATIVLEVSSQGAVMTLRKDTTVAGTTDLSRQTILTRWLDRNNREVNHDIVKAFHSLP